MLDNGQAQDGRMSFRQFTAPAWVRLLQGRSLYGWMTRLASYAVPAYLAWRDGDIVLSLFIITLAGFVFMDYLVDFSAGYWTGGFDAVQRLIELQRPKSKDDDA
jgi:hypothetical protein